MLAIREEANNAADGVEALQKKRQVLKSKAGNVTEAIAAFGHSPSLLAHLAAIEAELAKLNDRLAAMNLPDDLSASLDDLRQFLNEKALELRTILLADVETARQALSKHVEGLMLTPKGTPNGPIFEVSGDVELFSSNGSGAEVCSSNGGQGVVVLAVDFHCHHLPHLNWRCRNKANRSQRVEDRIGSMLPVVYRYGVIAVCALIVASYPASWIDSQADYCRRMNTHSNSADPLNQPSVHWVRAKKSALRT